MYKCVLDISYKLYVYNIMHNIVFAV